MRLIMQTEAAVIRCRYRQMFCKKIEVEIGRLWNFFHHHNSYTAANTTLSQTFQRPDPWTSRPVPFADCPRCLEFPVGRQSALKQNIINDCRYARVQQRITNLRISEHVTCIGLFLVIAIRHCTESWRVWTQLIILIFNKVIKDVLIIKKKKKVTSQSVFCFVL